MLLDGKVHLPKFIKTISLMNIIRGIDGALLWQSRGAVSALFELFERQFLFLLTTFIYPMLSDDSFEKQVEEASQSISYPNRSRTHSMAGRD